MSSVATSLLVRAKGDDQDSWSLLVELHAPLVYRWCRRRGLCADEALDVGQEVFISVARNLGRFSRHPDGGTFRGWLRTITENKIRDHQRRNYRQPSVTDQVDGVTAEDHTDQDESDRADVQAIFIQVMDYAKGRINPIHWNVFWELTVEERAAADVAAKYGIERHNVYMIKSRVLRLLREVVPDKVPPQ